MLPDHFAVLWNEKPIGVDTGSGGYPWKTNHPGMVRYWATKKEAQDYIDIFQRVDSQGTYASMRVVCVQFVLHEER